MSLVSEDCFLRYQMCDWSCDKMLTCSSIWGQWLCNSRNGKKQQSGWWSCPSNWKGNCVASPSHSPTYPSWQEDPGMNEIMKTGPWTVVIQKGLQSSLFCQHCYSTYCIHDRHSSSTVCILIHLTFTRTLEVGTILIACYRWGNWNGW